MEKILLAGRKDVMEKKKGLKRKVEKNENMWNLYENLNAENYLNKDEDLLTRYKFEQVASCPHKILRLFLI